tara:strand:- start:908 stop:1456 length:549 start_codon:yes stop_codon:yes gene_type:complete
MSGIDIDIKKSENIDLSENDILRITDNKTHILTYDQLKNFDNIDDVLGYHKSVVILYQTTRTEGHWVSLLAYDNNLEFFDPYGYGIDEELKIIEKIHLKEKSSGGIPPESPYLLYLINKSNYIIKVNTKQLQQKSSDINTCGRWVSLRIRFRDVTLRRFIELMTKNKYYNGDFFVSALTLLV